MNKGELKMRKLVLFLHASLDGIVEGPNGEMDIGWVSYDADLEKHAKEILSTADTVIWGRRTYQMMHSYWPSVPSITLITELVERGPIPEDQQQILSVRKHKVAVSKMKHEVAAAANLCFKYRIGHHNNRKLISLLGPFNGTKILLILNSYRGTNLVME
jgi:dihydrofolate reductase